MLIAIISDTHDNLPNIQKVLDYCREHGIEKIIHCGDLASHETLVHICERFTGDFLYVFGNADGGHHEFSSYQNSTFRNAKLFEKTGETEIENKKIAFTHFPEAALELAKSGDYDFVFHGHTHKPWSETYTHHNGQKTVIFNPGNVANQYYPPTFATWNTSNDNFELVRINELK